MHRHYVRGFRRHVLTSGDRASNGYVGYRIRKKGDNGLSVFRLQNRKKKAILGHSNGLHGLTLGGRRVVSTTICKSFRPSKQCNIFSSGIVVPVFRTRDGHHLRICSAISSLTITSFSKGQVVLSPLATSSAMLRAFPAFSTSKG